MGDRMQVSRTVDATPEHLFDVLTSPSKHAELDSADMLRGLEHDEPRLSGVGDEFTMKMNNSFMGDYRVKNTVVAYEKDRTIGWTPLLWPVGGYADRIGDMKPGGHTYTWHLEPAGEGRTKVTEVYDWSGVTCPQFRSLFPMLNEEQLGESIERAARAAG